MKQQLTSWAYRFLIVMSAVISSAVVLEAGKRWS